MIAARFEYLFILAIFAVTGLSLTWEGVTRALKRQSGRKALAIFFFYCLAVEIIALMQRWWVFDERRIVGVFVWRIPIEEFLLFITFGVIVLGAWEALDDERN